MSSYLGYGLLIFGIVIILFALLLGYGLYVGASTSQTPQQVQGNTINTSVKSALQVTVNQVTFNIGTGIEIIVLFLFASIGYKVADLGIKTLALYKDEEKVSEANGSNKSSKKS